MINYALVIIITKPNIPKYEMNTFIFNSLDDCYNKLIITFKDLINKKIDYPDNLIDYQNLYWYNDNNMDNEIINYNIFNSEEWIKPWDLEDLYKEVLDIINTLDIQDSIYNNKNYTEYCEDSDNEN